MFGLGGFVFHTDIELAFVFRSADIGDVIQGAVIEFLYHDGVRLQGVQCVFVTADDIIVLCFHSCSEPR